MPRKHKLPKMYRCETGELMPYPEFYKKPPARSRTPKSTKRPKPERQFKFCPECGHRLINNETNATETNTTETNTIRRLA